MAETPLSMTLPIVDAARSSRFLDAFFSPPNRLSREACAAGSGKLSSKFSPWVARVLRPEPVITVLPRWNLDNSFDWYGIASDPVTHRRLGEELMAFVGPTWSTFRGTPAILDPGDPIDCAVAEFIGGDITAFKFRDVGDAARVFAAIEMMRRAWEMRPSVTADAPRPIGRVLRDFYMALRVGNRLSAEEQLAYLGRRGQLNELNRLFLRVQMLSELNEPGELLSLPSLGDLLQTRRPLAVTQALLEAAYVVEISAVEADPLLALERCRAVEWKYGSLFTSDVAIRRPSALKFLMLHAASVSDVALRDRLLSIQVDDEVRIALANFGSLFAASEHLQATAISPLAAAIAAGDAGDFGTAFALARSADPTLRRAILLCQCAYEAPSLEAQQGAIEAVFGLSPSDFEAAMSRRLVREYVEAQTSPSTTAGAKIEANAAVVAVPQLVTNWVQWLEALYAGTLGKMGLEIARQGGEQWDLHWLARDEGTIARFSELLAEPPERWSTIVNEALPHILGFLQRDTEWPRKAFGPIYGSAAAVLAQTTTGAADDLALFNDLAAVRIETGVSNAEYTELLEQLRLLVDTFSAPATIEWMLDALEVLAFQPCPDSEARIRFLASAGTQFFRHRGRLTKDHCWLLERLHAEMNQSELYANLLPPEEVAGTIAADAQPESDPLRFYAGKSIAIYTLNERAAQVISELLQDRVPNVTVHTNNDLAGTPRLKALSQQADVFVMTLGSAKHAATDFIADNRPHNKPLLRTGKRSRGSSGILVQLVRYADSAIR